jgi:lipopolysaccharide transport system ATP-binding protein
LGSVLTDVVLGTQVRYAFTFDANLGEGSYSIAIALHSSDSHLANNYEWLDLALIFSVVNPEEAPFLGISWLPPTLNMEYL